ncbi:MAG TPA: hypothetical protein VEX15_00900 [Nocardioidaceae bacterium]|nr:hypothetical protein [Nocardioidaceae bacterium]
MTKPSRRKFLGLAGASAASAAAAVAIGTGALGRDDADESTEAVVDDDAPTSFVVHVTDVHRGEMKVLAGATEVDVRDRVMTANLARMRSA